MISLIVGGIEVFTGIGCIIGPLIGASLINPLDLLGVSD
jgi:predicted ABC-type sugar transport system permease subunit